MISPCVVGHCHVNRSDINRLADVASSDAQHHLQTPSLPT
jgi:hypothetical protein